MGKQLQIANSKVCKQKRLYSAKWVLLFSRRKLYHHCMHYPTSLSNAPQCPHIQEPPMHDEKSIFTEHTHPHPTPCCTAAAHMPPKVWATLGVMYIKMPTTWPWVLLLSINRLLVPKLCAMTVFFGVKSNTSNTFLWNCKRIHHNKSNP